MEFYFILALFYAAAPPGKWVVNLKVSLLSWTEAQGAAAALTIIFVSNYVSVSVYR